METHINRSRQTDIVLCSFQSVFGSARLPPENYPVHLGFESSILIAQTRTQR